MRRREFLAVAAAALILPARVLAGSGGAAPSLLTVPLAVQGAWQWPAAATRVLLRARAACLSGVRLLSDQQPDRLLVDDHTAGPPAVWLHDDGSRTAWVIVNIGGSDWSRLSYQFGHELGHVLANSWGPLARPRNPCQWLEEALVEAFSIRGLGRLAEGWGRNPPFAGDGAFGGALQRYRDDLVAGYEQVAREQGAGGDLAAWFRTERPRLEVDGGVAGMARGAVPAFLRELEADAAAAEGIGAMNRWPERTGLPLDDYLQRWQRSCAAIGAADRLPRRLRGLLLGG